jgi:hypothetical protein
MKKKEINKISKKIFKKLNKIYFTQKEGGDIYLNEAKDKIWESLMYYKHNFG